ncbi:putative quinol monooxygenase [Bradyrhizobium sp.]|uniref:putative quinol monooxygenase n=1 Tax=Bradyrhizobium sp. TaxID=376 RepID=UPI003C3A8C34
MVKFGFYVELKAKPGKQADVEAFLKQSAALAKDEAGIVSWYAVKEEEPGVFGIVDTFADEVAWNAHANGELAKALFGKADELFSEPPKVHRLQIVALK